MSVRAAPAIVVICAAGGGPAIRRPVATVTRVVDLEALPRVAADGDGADLALVIDPRWLASRQALRSALVRARHAAPRLEAAVLPRGPLAHHSVLAEEGIRVALVDEFGAVGRGSRRPAPAGWPCRNVAWGLWEVRPCPPRRSPAWAWVPGLPAPRRGGLHVAMARDDAHLQRLLAWSVRGVSRGQATAVDLSGLPAVLEGRRPAPLAASVLKAA